MALMTDNPESSTPPLGCRVDSPRDARSPSSTREEKADRPRDKAEDYKDELSLLVDRCYRSQTASIWSLVFVLVALLGAACIGGYAVYEGTWQPTSLNIGVL